MAELLSFPKDVCTDLQIWSVSCAILQSFPGRLSWESGPLPQTVQTVWMCGCPCLWVLGSFWHLRDTFKSLLVAQLHCPKHWVVICLLEDPFRMCSAAPHAPALAARGRDVLVVSLERAWEGIAAPCFTLWET